VSELTQARLRELLSYDASTGSMHWLVKPNRRDPAGMVAGRHDRDGYVIIRINGRNYRRARLAWFFVYGKWPAHIVDHANGRCHDDRIANLREVTSAQNNTNRRPRGHLGIKGVFPSHGGGGFVASIVLMGRKRYLGTWPTAEEAGAAYNHMARVLYGEYAYTARPQ